MALAIGKAPPPEVIAATQTSAKLVVLPMATRLKSEESAEAAGLAVGASSKANVRSLAQAERTANEGVSAVQALDASLDRVEHLMTRTIEVVDEVQTTSLEDVGREELSRIYDELRLEASSTLEDVRHARFELSTNLETLQETIEILRSERGAFPQGQGTTEPTAALEQAETTRERIVQSAGPSIRVQANESPEVAKELLNSRPPR